MTTPPMFVAPPSPALRLSQHFATTARQAGPKYAAYNVKGRVQCEECVWTVHEAKGVGGAAICAACVKRTAGDMSTLLCTGHAELWKTREAAAKTGQRR